VRYRIKLRIRYDYESSVAHARHLICVLPRSMPGMQTIKQSQITITPRPDETLDRHDHFGNSVTEVGYRTRHNGISLLMEAEVDRVRPVYPIQSTRLADLPQALAQSHAVLSDAPLNFVASSPRIELDDEISEFARAAIPAGPETHDAVLAVGQAIHEHMTFDAKATEVDTPASVAFTHRRGVCQDFSHIMISALRSLGIPCGYVSGYLRTIPPKGMPRLEGADAMHAWVRAWCGPEAGWIEYDPTNETVVGEDHIVCAIGRDYSDISPIKGVVRTSGGQKSRQSVDVLPLK
jgi:transglutaminase-like putative cysteine protease